MTPRKNKRETPNIVELDIDESNFILEPAKVEIGSGYALTIDHNENDQPIVNVKTYGTVDLNKIQKEIHHIFPNAQICKLNQVGTITITKKNKGTERKK